MSDDYRQRVAEALASTNTFDEIDLEHTLGLVLAARDDELERVRAAFDLAEELRQKDAARLRAERDAARDSRDETHVWTNTDWKERAEHARAEADQLRAELARRIDADAESLADRTLLKGLSVKDGAVNLDLIPPREIAAVWVRCAVGMLGDAPNYTETEVKMPSVSMEISPAGTLDRYALIVQRVGKLTPHEARQAAEAERDAWRELVRELADDGPCHYDHHDQCQGHSLDYRPCPHARAKELLAALDPKEDR
ncbi:hypothetical protein [Nonomuraea sp. NPDC049750]|uniref:hypothetical protein n=1 Tax=Nonomuraea sp. NPDC049750 TaxID=3154738 RepID=UPI0033D875D1